MVKKLLSSIGLLLVLSIGLMGQSGTIRGTVIDKDTKEPIPFANVVVQVDGIQKGGCATDFDGIFTIKPLEPGSYTLIAQFVGYKTQQINGVHVSADVITFQDVELSSGAVGLDEVEVIEYEVPLISKDRTQSGGTVTSEEIEKMPEKSIAAVASTVGGVFSRDGEVGSIRGQRSSGTVYYIDGIKVTGSTALPQSAYDQISVILGGIPAQYGDATGGIISATTKGPSRVFGMGIEFQSSGLGEGKGLDAYGYNRLGVNLNGPLIQSRNPDKPGAILGYFIASDFIYQADNRPTAKGTYVATPEYIDYLTQNPIRLSDEGTGVWNEASFVTRDDLMFVKQNLNTPKLEMALSGKLDVKTSEMTNLSFGGSFNYSNYRGFNFTNSMFNYDKNVQYLSSTWRVYGRFTQRFRSSEDAKIKNVFYELQADYTQYNYKYQDAHFQDDLFSYGYIGQYNTHRSRSYEMATVNIDGKDVDAMTFAGYVEDSVTYRPGTQNQVLANYMSKYYELFAGETDYYRNTNSILAASGLLNGYAPSSVYNLFGTLGSNQSGYYIADNQQIGVSFKASADIGGHALQFGFQFEQKINSYFSASTTSLWTLMRSRVNSHITELDTENPIPLMDENGVFLGVIDYNYLYSATSQSTFDYELRKMMNLPIDGTQWIDVDSYDPVNNTMNYYDEEGKYQTASLNGNLGLSMFSPDELLNDGGQYVGYAGFDAYGNKLKTNPTIDDFFTDTLSNGKYSRTIGAIRPIYGALFLQDVFTFRDLVFNIGVRVDRYDANQAVLDDEYLLTSRAYTVADYKDAVNRGAIANIGDVPTNMGDDYIVYVNSVNDPSQILGFREGSNWFDAVGTSTSDPETVLNAGNGISPYLLDPQNNNLVTREAFTDYQPQINVMPRISFSFPISDEALFFAHYDILTQRPTSYNTLSLTEYYFLPTSTSTTVNNPNLKPETTIDYEVGFQQKLTNTSSLSLSAFYREIRDQICIYRVTGAYPKTYYSYKNLDFGTVKGLTATFDLRRTGNIRLKASYTLQFANGTGSDPDATQAVVTSGQPNLRTLSPLNEDQRHRITLNLDYRFADGKDYNGPVTRRVTKDGTEKHINWLQNTGVNINFMGGSGTPYTRSSKVYSITNSQRVIEGSINGSRMPAFWRCDIIFDKDIYLSNKTKKDGSNQSYLNVYLQILNLFNTANVASVYAATGNADDDGYLTAAEWQTEISQQLSVDAYRMLYEMRVDSPGNYSGPRLIRLGLSYNF